MSGVAGYQFLIKKSGTSTSLTDEPLNNTAGDTWRITDSAKRVLDRTDTFTFYDNAVAIDSADIDNIDYLFGEVTFTSTKTGPITVDGSYMPMANIACAKDATLNRTSVILDDTCIGNDGYHTKEYGLLDASVSASRWFDVDYSFHDVITSRAPVVIEITPGSNYSYKGWYIPAEVSDTLDVTALLEESLSFQLDGGIILGASFSRKLIS